VQVAPGLPAFAIASRQCQFLAVSYAFRSENEPPLATGDPFWR
jgi:hypothetical protein